MPNFATLYSSQEYYDCTFLIGSTSPQIFKCHKSILERASELLKIMLHGKLISDASFGKDTPIKIDNVEPRAFHFAMRCIYGDNVNAQNDKVAAQAYLFAHEWQIDELKKKLEMHFQDTRKIRLKWILQVYEMYKALNEDEKLDIIMKKINTNIEKVLRSTSWLQAKEETVVAILGSPIPSTVNEEMLYHALVKWGKYTLKRQARGGNAEDKKTLRGVISKGLRFIRFRNMSCCKFAHIFLTSKILSKREQLSIMRSMSLRNGNLMPAAFSGSKGPRIRKHKN